MLTSSKSTAQHVLQLLREFRALESKRVGPGVTPLEYQRWLDVQRELKQSIPQGNPPGGVERRRHRRIPTRMLVRFRTLDGLRDAVIHNISTGGLFINTPFAAEIGTELTLCIQVADSDDALDLHCEVVSTNIGDGFSTGELGMGVKFTSLDSQGRRAVDQLLAAALGAEHGDDEEDGA